MRKIALAIAMMLAAPAALAAGPDARQYWGLAAGLANIERYDFGVATGLYGYELIPHLAIEGRIGTSTKDNNFRVEYFGSALLRLNILADDIRPYVLLGASHVHTYFSHPLSSGSDDESGFTWGGGLSLHTGNFGVQFEYIRYLDKDGGVLDGVNVGLIGHF